MKIENMLIPNTGTGKTWVFTGGAKAAGSYAEEGCFRNCAGLFEEVIRWNMGWESVESRERFVINTAKPGLTVLDIIRDFQSRAACYGPAALVYLSGQEDRSLPEDVFKQALCELENKAREMGAGFLWMPYEGDSAMMADAVLRAVGAQPSLITSQDRARFHLAPALETFEESGKLILKDKPMQWLFIGDSITHGALHTRGGDSLPQLWEKYLKEGLDRRDDVVINTGVSGAMAKDFLDRLDIRYLPYAAADVVIAMFGTNDCCDPDTDSELFYERMLRIAGVVQANNSQFVIRTPQPVKPEAGERAETMKAFVAAARRAAQKSGAILVDHDRNFNKLLKENPAGYDACMSDAIHPNAQGQYRMFREMAYSVGLAKDVPMIRQTCLEHSPNTSQ